LILVALIFLLRPPVVGAELEFKEPVANAGTIYTGQPLRHRFAFTNSGPHVAEIREIQASCGCLAPRLSSRTLKPGEEATLDLEVHTLSQAEGTHAWTVHLRYQMDDQLYETVLQLNARVLTEVRVQPAAMVLSAGRTAGHQLTVTDLRSKPVKITSVQASSSRMTTKLCAPERDEAGHWLQKIDLGIGEDIPDGRYEEIVAIYTDDPKYAELRVPVTLVKRAADRLTAMPREVVLTGVAGQPLPSRIVLIRDAANQAVKIDHIMTDDPAITCRWAPGPNTMATLKIQVDRTRIHGDGLESAVHVHVSEPVPETIVIPVRVIGH
jgi:hypothetical protein